MQEITSTKGKCEMGSIFKEHVRVTVTFFWNEPEDRVDAHVDFSAKGIEHKTGHFLVTDCDAHQSQTWHLHSSVGTITVSYHCSKWIHDRHACTIAGTLHAHIKGDGMSDDVVWDNEGRFSGHYSAASGVRARVTGSLGTGANLSIDSVDVDELATLLERFARSCEIEVTNNTKYCWVGHSFFAAHGKFVPSTPLPAIAPRFSDNTGRTIVFSAGASMSNRASSLVAPTGVAIWEALDSKLYLIVYADIYSHSSNEGSFFLQTEDPVDAKTWYGTNKDKESDYGSLSANYRATVDGITVDGSLTDDRNGVLQVSLSQD